MQPVPAPYNQSWLLALKVREEAAAAAAAAAGRPSSPSGPEQEAAGAAADANVAQQAAEQNVRCQELIASVNRRAVSDRALIALAPATCLQHVCRAQ